MTATQTKKQEAIAELRDMLKPGDTIYTKLVHRAKSGMYRTIDLYLIRNNEPLRITWGACQAIGARYDTKHEAMGMSGCGTDMGFEAVYNLGRALYPDGIGCCGENCQSNDHTNGDRDYTPSVQVLSDEVILRDEMRLSSATNTHWHNDGGYAFKHRWL